LTLWIIPGHNLAGMTAIPALGMLMAFLSRLRSINVHGSDGNRDSPCRRLSETRVRFGEQPFGI
jgi:hypothetical protein